MNLTFGIIGLAVFFGALIACFYALFYWLAFMVDYWQEPEPKGFFAKYFGTASAKWFFRDNLPVKALSHRRKASLGTLTFVGFLLIAMLIKLIASN